MARHQGRREEPSSILHHPKGLLGSGHDGTHSASESPRSLSALLGGSRKACQKCVNHIVPALIPISPVVSISNVGIGNHEMRAKRCAHIARMDG
jgi:hypothetical protein